MLEFSDFALVFVIIGAVVYLFCTPQTRIDIDDELQYYVSAKLNSSFIVDSMYSYLLGESKILVFYSQDEGNQHGFVVFATDQGYVFKCHLVGIPGKLYIRTQLTEWNADFPKRKCTKPTQQLKQHIEEVVKTFGPYKLGTNDCRNFAKKLAHFLAN